jgi:CheY-like chemotaxis protein
MGVSTMALATVMIVDDDRSFVEALSILLQDHGYHTLNAFSGRQGLALFRGGRVDLAIIDLHMPDVSGIEVAKAARRASPPIPAIMISADDGPDVQRQCQAIGVRSFMPKPLAPDELLQTIAQALDRNN